RQPRLRQRNFLDVGLRGRRQARGGGVEGRRRGRGSGRGIGAKRRLQRLAQHDQRGLEIGNAARGRRARCQRRFEENARLLKRRLDVVAVEILVEAGLLRQHLGNRRLQFRRQAAGGDGGAEIGKQRREAFL